MTSTAIDQLINHVAIVIDRSTSMQRHAAKVVEVVDEQIKSLAELSQDFNQETRITMYGFGSDVNCYVYDKDVLRLPSIRDLYKVTGNTAMLDATCQAIDELGQASQLYGDHAFLLIVVTDGEENWSKRFNSRDLSQRLARLRDSWSVACLVPDQRGVGYAETYGFPRGNIKVWNAASVTGFQQVATDITTATRTFMTNRGAGIRSTANLFTVDTSHLDKQTVQQHLDKLHPGQYRMFQVPYAASIAPFVESQGVPYQLGHAFYQLTKTEKVQGGKAICVYDKATKSVYTGANARALLGLPNYDAKVYPASHPNYEIFVQSTSVNRKLVPGTYLLYV